MRIAVIAPPWVPTPPPAYGGIEAVLESLASGLQDAGHEVVLFATGDSHSQVPVGYWFEEAMGVGRKDGTLVELVHVISAYDMVKSFDIVHDHTAIGPVYSARYGDLPVVTTNHAPFELWIEKYYRSIGERVPVIAISQSQARSVSGVNLAGVIYHGVDIGEFPLGRGDGGYALFLGRMNPDKGVHNAIEVARAAGVPLKIAAKCREDSEKAYFKDVIKPMLGNGIEYLGEANREEKGELLSGAICLLNPIAWREPFGMVMLESLACGTPVIATHAGSAPEIVQEGRTGFLSDTIDGLVEAVQSVGTLDRRACRNSVEERFSREIMVKRHIEVYEKVIANFGGRGPEDTAVAPISDLARRGGEPSGEVPDDFSSLKTAMGM